MSNTSSAMFTRTKHRRAVARQTGSDRRHKPIGLRQRTKTSVLLTIVGMALLLVGCRSLIPRVANEGDGSVAMAAQSHTQPDLNTTLQPIVDTWRQEHDVIGITVAISSPQTSLIALASGMADPENDRAMQATDPMYVGSIAKSFVAATVLQLVQAGELSLEDRLSQWYPAYPFADEITIAQLLNMTSGTFDYFRATPDNPFLGMVMQDINRVWTPDEIIDVTTTLEPSAAPGDGYWYSNTNYLLLGRIIEVVTGNPLADELRQRFYEPLGLATTSMAGDEELPATLATGYVRDYAFLFGADAPKSTKAMDYQGLQSVFWAAGGLVSNGHDLVRWARAYYGGALWDQDHYTRMITPNGFVNDEGKSYGYAVEYYETVAGPALGHPGSIPGYASLTLYIAEYDLAIAVLTNDNEHAEAVLLHLVDELLYALLDTIG